MRRALVVLLATGMAGPSGAADPPRPPGRAAAPSLIEHEFEPWEYSNGQVICIHWDPLRLRLCERPEVEHASAQVDEEHS
jgi:hypothetical protein